MNLHVATKALWMLAAFHVCVCNALAAQLPPDIQVDLYLVRAERQMDAGNFVAAKASLDRILAASRQHDLEVPAVVWFRHGQMAFESGLLRAAKKRLTRYLQMADREDEHYADALELLDSVQEQQRKKKEERRRKAEQAYREWTGPRKDCADCPVMIAIPSGTLQMGSSPNEEGREDDEGPIRQVTIAAPFAIGVYEVTFAQWDACVAAGNCSTSHRPDDSGWGRGDHPVIDVVLSQAWLYVGWLTRRTGKIYRLPSESEWEYAARAGTTSPFHTGATISTDDANYDGNYVYGSGRKGVYRERTMPVGTFRPNAWGLHDMHGNVYEWVGDCWHSSYLGGPSDSGTWRSRICSDRYVVRGGSWYSRPKHLRSAGRSWISAFNHNNKIGFRVVRQLGQ